VAVPNMSEEQYRKLTPWQKRAYWAIVVVACAFIGYMLISYD
jgi:hypothetical protein